VYDCSAISKHIWQRSVNLRLPYQKKEKKETFLSLHDERQSAAAGYQPTTRAPSSTFQRRTTDYWTTFSCQLEDDNAIAMDSPYPSPRQANNKPRLLLSAPRPRFQELHRSFARLVPPSRNHEGAPHYARRHALGRPNGKGHGHHVLGAARRDRTGAARPCHKARHRPLQLRRSRRPHGAPRRRAWYPRHLW
jgi:hypothetical protein